MGQKKALKPNAILNKLHRVFGKIEGHTCGECLNLVTKEYSKNYHKCKVVGTSGNPKTDWRKGYQACGKFIPKIVGVNCQEEQRRVRRRRSKGSNSLLVDSLSAGVSSDTPKSA